MSNQQFIEQRALSLNQACRDQNRDKILQILSLPEAPQIMSVLDDSQYIPLFWACSSLPEKVAM